MDLVAVVNPGSSSVKISFFDEELHCLHQGSLSKIHLAAPLLHVDGETKTLDGPLDLNQALELLFQRIGVQPQSIGYRFVHGGPFFHELTPLDESVVEKLLSIVDLAPLHIQTGVDAFRKCESLFGKEVKHFALFDTGFFHALPEPARHYAIPLELSKKHHIYRYGFHGISHQYLRDKLEAYFQSMPKRAITLHLGSGCSATAHLMGKPIDTSMGLTPLEGLVMSTRSGSVDPTLVDYISKKERVSIDEALNLLNKESGWKGVSGLSSDLGAVLQSDTKEARLAVSLFLRSVVTCIGGYIAELGGLDALVFSAGVGENSAEIRESVTHALAWMGVEIDLDVNRSIQGVKEGQVVLISAPHSKVSVFVIGTDENYEIARSLLAKEGFSRKE